MRKQNWPELLDKYITENNSQTYKYGVFDCVTFGAEWIALIMDVDILDGIKYKGIKSALSLLNKHGGLFKMTSVQMGKAGLKKTHPALAKRGDIVGFMTEAHGETVGICIGRQVVSPGENKLIFLPMTDAVIAWEIV